jgi:hypothetical protein
VIEDDEDEGPSPADTALADPQADITPATAEA